MIFKRCSTRPTTQHCVRSATADRTPYLQQSRCIRPQRQRGVAVITALLLTTLAVTIVASLFWQQQVQVRSIENQRMQLQKQWILRGALDWACLILRESGKVSPSVDNLQQPWAVGLAETRLDSYVENGRSDSEASDASISGKIIDATSRLNLRGLSSGGKPDEVEMKAFGKLLTLLKINPALAQATAITMAAGQPKQAPLLGGQTRVPAVAATTPATPAPTSTTGTGTGTGTGTATTVTLPLDANRPMEITQVDDLLAVPGFTPAIVAQLRNYVIILPGVTAVNFNTTSAEVLAARVDTLSLAEAQAIILDRDRAFARDDADLKSRLRDRPATGLAVRTDYFLVDGKVKLNRAGLEVQALIQRSGGKSTVLWIRET